MKLDNSLIRPVIHVLALSVLAPAMLGGLAGCGGTDTTMDVQMAAAVRPDVDEKLTERGPLSMPDAQGFNYDSFRSGQTGAGRGESTSVGVGGAMCRADVDGEGTAWGEFQLGYAFDNASDQPINGIVKLRLRCSEKNAVKGAAPDDAADSSTSKTTLVFFVKDSYGAVVKTENLLASSLAAGPREFRSVPELIFDLRFEPMRGYYLIVAGRADSSGIDGEQVSSAVEISDLALQIDWRAPESVATNSNQPVVVQTAAPDADGEDSQP